MKLEFIKNEVINIIKLVKKDSDATYEENMHLSSQGVDSLDMYDILIKIEEKFNLTINTDEIFEEDWQTINKMVKQITNLLSATIV